MQLTDPVLLDAVNSILSSINEDGVNSLVDLEDTDAINALNMLKEVNRTFQSRGWSFNTFENFTLNVDVMNHKIQWPDNVLSIISEDYNVVKQNGYVYDIDNQTYVFPADIQATVVLFMDFSSIPVSAQEYVIAKASSKFSNRYLGDDSLSKMLLQREQEAWSYFNEYEHLAEPANMLENTYISGVKER